MMVTTARFPANDQARRVMIAKVKIAQKQLGMLDDDYRALLLRTSGRSSAADCTEAELVKMLDEMKRLGFTALPGKGRSARKAHFPQFPAANKARALWISLHQLGVVRDADDRALEKFACKQMGVTAFAWADQSQCYKLIEALKAMAQRAGWDQDLTGIKHGDQALAVLKRRLASLLLDKMKEDGLVPRGWSVSGAAFRLLGIADETPFCAMGVEALDRIIRGFAEQRRTMIETVRS